VSARAKRPPRTLKQRAIALLARRDYARAELVARLAAAGGPPDEIESLMRELELAGYVSDARFASAVVRQKSGTFGKRAIAHALRDKGVDRAVADEALGALAGVDELEAAMALWQRRFGAPPANEREKARQLRFIVARGFSSSVAFAVLKRAGAQPDEDEPAR
jgi:regulatory protein